MTHTDQRCGTCTFFKTDKQNDVAWGNCLYTAHKEILRPIWAAWGGRTYGMGKSYTTALQMLEIEVYAGDIQVTQKQRVLKFMKRGRGQAITTYVATISLGVCRLSERIRELERDGVKIDRKVVQRFGQYGVTRVMEYRLGR